MAEDIFEVKRERFDLLRPEIYLLQGTWPEGYRVEAYLKKQQISGEVMPWDYVSVLERAVAHEHEGTKRVTVSLTMPKKNRAVRKTGHLCNTWRQEEQVV